MRLFVPFKAQHKYTIEFKVANKTAPNESRQKQNTNPQAVKCRPQMFTQNLRALPKAKQMGWYRLSEVGGDIHLNIF